MKIKTILAITLITACCCNAFGQLSPQRQKEEEERRQQYEKEREYWSTWPRTLSDEEMALLDRDFEKKFNCVFLDNSGPLLTDNKLCESEHRRANTWLQGSGKSLIVFYDEFFQKINPNGLIVAWGLSRYQTDLEELKWYEEEKEKRLRLSRGKWAQDRGMTLEEASQKFKEWTESNPRPIPMLRWGGRPMLRSGGLMRHPSHPSVPRPETKQGMSGLDMARARRAAELQRQASEQAKKERELAAEERKAQLAQLMQIREELRRQREEKLRELKQHEQNNNK